MDTTKEYTSALTAAKDFFGLQQGQTLIDFKGEWGKLTLADKAEIKEGLVANGYKIKA